MGLVAMAQATLWNSTCPQGGVFQVAALAADLGLVLASLRVYSCRLLGVAMDTMRIGQRRHLCRMPGLYMDTKYHK